MREENYTLVFERYLIEAIKFFIYRLPRFLYITLIRTIDILVFNNHNDAKKNIDVRPADVDAVGQTILFNIVEFNHYQSHQLMWLARDFKSQGHEVVVLNCSGGLDACEVKSSTNIFFPCFECKLFGKLIPTLHQLRTIDICGHGDSSFKDIKSLEIDRFSNTKAIAAHESVVRHYYGDNVKGLGYRRQLARELASYERIMGKFSDIVQKEKVSHVIANMFVYSTWAPQYDYSNFIGLKYTVISNTAYYNNRVVINRHNLYSSPNRWQNFLRDRSALPLNSDESAQLDSYLSRRITAKDSYISRFQFEKYGIKFENLSHKTITFFSNIHWDIGLPSESQLFTSVIGWLVTSINEIHKADPEGELFNICVKVHPAEKLDTVKSKKGIASILMLELDESAFNRIKFITPNEKISPYEAARASDLNVILNGTLGLELVLMGMKNVLIGGNAPYRFAVGQECFKMNDYIDALLLKREIPSIDNHLVKLFGFFYFVDQCIIWPYTDIAFGGTFHSSFMLQKRSKKHLDRLYSAVSS
jgi:hypothetical protein